MRYAKVVPDIPTRAIDGCFDYAVPPALEQSCQVGCTVLVRFGHWDVVGYVVGLGSLPGEGVDPARVREVMRVLAAPAFDEVGAKLARWMSREYAAPLAVCLRLMMPPGQTMRVRREDGGEWQLVVERTNAVDDRWASLTEAGRAFEPRANATRQRQVIEALRAGQMRVAELSAMVSGAGQVVSALAKRGLVSVERRRRVRGNGEQTTLSSANAPKPERLTAGQVQALEAIAAATDAGRGDVVVVDGVTGSGKTEVYLSAIERVRAQGKGAIVLVPEISLTAQTVGRFRSRFGDDVAILHSRLSTGERFDQWDMARSGAAHVVVGARSALFAPLANVGLVIVDEEHEGSYKQDQAPRYHAREAACELARLRGAAVVLGSATPSLESLERCRQGSWRAVSWTRVEMPERPGGAELPRVRVVDMRQQFAAKNGSCFSTVLKEALREVVRRRQKAVLLLNRRGFASFLMCRECGCVPTCTHCSTALTYHERTHSLVCHSCARSWPVRAYPDPSTKCPNCGSRYLAQYGLGTQRVEDELKMLLATVQEEIATESACGACVAGEEVAGGLDAGGPAACASSGSAQNGVTVGLRVGGSFGSRGPDATTHASEAPASAAVSARCGEGACPGEGDGSSSSNKSQVDSAESTVDAAKPIVCAAESAAVSRVGSVDVIRMDADTTSAKGAHTRLLERFDASECAVLVGTQMIAKGLDFPEVTLVGVINADTTLKLPDFRAAERTYDLLEQVSGRAGRGGAAGQVIIQTYWATHPAIQAVAHHSRSKFEAYELEQREEAYYPPFSRVANVTLTGKNEAALRERSRQLGHALRDAVDELEGDWEVLGPAECVRARVKDRYRRHLVVKAPPTAEMGPVIEAAANTLPARRDITLSIDVDAYDML